MTKDYKQINPVAQIEPMSCWAASMEWWLRYMTPGIRTFRTQDEIAAITEIYKHIDYNIEGPGYGGLSEAGVIALCKVFDLNYKIFSALTLENIRTILVESMSPLLVIYNDINAGGYHANIIIKRFKTFGTPRGVIAMEPNGGSFQYRFIEYYNRGQLYLAYAK